MVLKIALTMSQHPTEPVPCNNQNKGHCECGDTKVKDFKLTLSGLEMTKGVSLFSSHLKDLQKACQLSSTPIAMPETSYKALTWWILFLPSILLHQGTDLYDLVYQVLIMLGHLAIMEL